MKDITSSYTDYSQIAKSWSEREKLDIQNSSDLSDPNTLSSPFTKLIKESRRGAIFLTVSLANTHQSIAGI